VLSSEEDQEIVIDTENLVRF